MSNYLRAWIPGGTYFFTVNLAERRNTTLLIDHIAQLREAFRVVRRVHPFVIEAMVVLPDHLHCIWRLPPGDDGFAFRWRLIKARFSASLVAGERISPSRLRKGERGIWQRRYWEHVIRDEEDWRRHLDYIHCNPVKHGHVQRVCDWPHSSFHRFVRQGVYMENWAAPELIAEFDAE
ncbi:MAG: transposase [Steroidobacteraceae bacterium]